ncbi:MAG: hypothetical protein SNG60_07845 [Rikenellaceae bacterium]
MTRFTLAGVVQTTSAQPKQNALLYKAKCRVVRLNKRTLIA